MHGLSCFSLQGKPNIFQQLDISQLLRSSLQPFLSNNPPFPKSQDTMKNPTLNSIKIFVGNSIILPHPRKYTYWC